MSRLFGLFAPLFLAALVAGCIFSSDDTGGKEEPPPPGIPEVTWVSISDGQVVKSRNITVSWKGNEHARRFRYTLDSISSAWFDSAFCVLSDLAEGAHTFAVQAANDSLTGEPLTVRFTVDAGSGPGIRFSPGTVANTAYVSLFLEEMSGIMAAHIEIACVDSSARLKEFAAGAGVTGNGIVVFADARDPYRLILDIGFPGKSGGFSGSLELGSFVISPAKTEGTVAVDPQKTVFRDTSNRSVTIERFEALRVKR
ncbi:MAG: hypothetical protein ACYC9O_15325 [Candidatus Latescibacterota bacterium]